MSLGDLIRIPDSAIAQLACGCSVHDRTGYPRAMVSPCAFHGAWLRDAFTTHKPDRLTKREQFALAAMQGLCANQRFLYELQAMCPDDVKQRAKFARGCFCVADAMLAESAKVPS